MERPDFIKKADFDKVVLACVESGVNPYLMFAIGVHETGWGTMGWGKSGYILGVGCYDAIHVNESLKGFDNQIGWAVKAVSEFMGFEMSFQALFNFAKYVWKPGNPLTWAKGVFSHYIDLVSKYAQDLTVWEEPPEWAISGLMALYKKGMLNTPFGSAVFYRTTQIVYNAVFLDTTKERG